MKSINNSRVIDNLFWKLLEQFGMQGMQLVIQIALARLLLPEEFGIIAIVLVIINFSNIFIQSGLNIALIQKDNSDNLDFSSVFIISLFFSVVLYSLMFVFSPKIALFYNIPELITLIRVLSVILFPMTLKSIQIAYLSKKMDFKKQFYSSLVGTFFSGILGVSLAFNGFGVWALVAQHIINTILNVIILWITVDWKPTLEISFTRIKSLYSFGWKILMSGIIYNLYNDLRSLVIGKMYTPEILGFYNRGYQLPALLINSVDGSIQSVMLPTYSVHQKDRAKIKSMMQISIKIGSFIIFPIMVGLAVTSEYLVILLLTEKWLPAVPFIKLFCISLALRPINSANQQAINAIGRSDITLKLSVLKRSIELIILLITVRYGVYSIALGGVFAALLGSIINIIPNKELFNYTIKEQVSDVLPAAIVSFFMGIIIYVFSFLNYSAVLTFILQVVFGIIAYYGLSKWINRYAFLIVYDTIIFYLKGESKDN